MKREIFVLIFSAIFLISCTGVEGNKETNVSPAANQNKTRQANESVNSSSNSMSPSPSLSETNAAKSPPPVVNSDGQNTTYSTAGELEIAGKRNSV